MIRFHLVLAGAAVAALVIFVASTGVLRWGLWTLLCTLTGLWVGLGVSFPQLQMFGRSLCRGETSEKIVALTFDDGPDPVNTPMLLDLLARNQARATFFCVGKQVERFPDIVRRIAAEGHQVVITAHPGEFAVKDGFAKAGQVSRRVPAGIGKRHEDKLHGEDG